MKAGSLLTYWENEEDNVRTPGSTFDEGKWTSPVYSLAVQHQAVWLLSGLESGGINLQTCRHQAGTKITTLRAHSNAVSVLTLSQDETNLLSGSWDTTVNDWDLQTGKVKRTYEEGTGQISAVEVRPLSEVPVPEVARESPRSFNDLFSSNNASDPLANGFFGSAGVGDGDEDALGSPSGSLFGEGDHGSLFGEDNAVGGGGGNAFGDDQDELSRVMAAELQRDATSMMAPQDEDTEMTDINGNPLPSHLSSVTARFDESEATHDRQLNGVDQPTVENSNDAGIAESSRTLPHSFDLPTAPPTDGSKPNSSADLPPQSESTFLDSTIDGTLRVWDRRMSTAIATLPPSSGTPPWCHGACWSPDGNSFYAGRRNGTVEEFSIHKLGHLRGKPDRVFRFQHGSGPVYAVRPLPNGRHLVWCAPPFLSPYYKQN